MKSKEKRKQQIKRSIYWIAMASFVVVVIWIMFEIFWAYNNNENVVVVKESLDPIGESLYVELADELATRSTVSDEELDTFADQIRISGIQVTPAIQEDEVIVETSSISAQPVQESTDSGLVQENI